MVRKQQSSSESEPTKRKRGRPSGKNRVPLSLEERRARNAQYERERRNEKSEAMAQLAEAIGCDLSIGTTDLLATVISRIQRAAEINPAEDIEKLRRINGNLMSQIDKLENELKVLCPDFDGTNIDDLSEQSESSSDLTSLPSSSSESSKRSRSKKSTDKRKRKNYKRKVSDSQDSNDNQSESGNENIPAKRMKIKLETNETKNVPVSRRKTRNTPSSHSSYEIAQEGVLVNATSTSDQTSSDEQSNLSFATSHQEVESNGSPPENLPWINSDIIDIELPTIPDELISLSTSDLIYPNLTIQEPLMDYPTSQTYYDSVAPMQEENTGSLTEFPIEYELRSDPFEIPLPYEVQPIMDSEWFDSNFFLNTDNIPSSSIVFS